MKVNKYDKVYIAIDLKSFYASVECQERGLNPITTNLVVADSSRTEKTVCLAVSPTLKQYGIPGRGLCVFLATVWPSAEIRRLCETAYRGDDVGQAACHVAALLHAGSLSRGGGMPGLDFFLSWRKEAAGLGYDRGQAAGIGIGKRGKETFGFLLPGREEPGCAEGAR